MLKACGINKTYENQPILCNVDLTVNDRDFLSIMGESGSGKSTFLNILAGNLRPDSGRVLLDGMDISAMDEKALAKLRRTALGFVYQSLNLIPTLNAQDNILLPLYLNHNSIREGKAEMEKLAETLRITHLLSKFPHTMSGGERQRIAIARAMIHHPSVLMLDEPTGSLDSRATEDVMELLRQLNNEWKITVIQVTHSAHAASYGTRTVTLCNGKVEDL